MDPDAFLRLALTILAAFLLPLGLVSVLRWLAAPSSSETDRGPFAGGMPAPNGGRLRLRIEGREAALFAAAGLVLLPAFAIAQRVLPNGGGRRTFVLIGVTALVIGVHQWRRAGE